MLSCFYFRLKVDGIGVDESYVLMAGGLPNSEVFPITGMELTLR